MVDSLYHLISLLFFDIPLLYYIIIFILHQRIIFNSFQKRPSFNLRLLIILCHISGVINLPLSIPSFVSELFFGEVF